MASSPKHKYQNLLETLPICQKMVPDVTEKEENPLSNIFTIFSSSSTALYYFMAYNLLWKAFSESTFRKSGNENSKIT